MQTEFTNCSSWMEKGKHCLYFLIFVLVNFLSIIFGTGGEVLGHFSPDLVYLLIDKMPATCTIVEEHVNDENPPNVSGSFIDTRFARYRWLIGVVMDIVTVYSVDRLVRGWTSMKTHERKRYS